MVTAFVADEIKRLVGMIRPEYGLCALADGADQVFAETLVTGGIPLHVVIPSVGYEETFDAKAARARYEGLVLAASDVVRLPFPGPSEEAFWAAGRWVVDNTDLLFAVWDGTPARGLGGTADVVAYARSLGRPVQVIWPEGVRRE